MSHSRPDSDSAASCSTLIELLRWRALRQPGQLAYIYLLDGETTEAQLTYHELDERARAIGTHLQSLGAAGERALLLYPPGLDYVTAFFGCLYAGLIAVPAYPPRLNRPMPRLQTMVSDAQVSVALTTPQILASLESRFDHLPDLKALHWLSTDNIANAQAEAWQMPTISANSLAFLQYTSGSTATPRGVMLTHANLLHNLRQIQACFETTSDSQGVFWLPLYHDMGLIGGMLEALYCGGTSTLMSAVDFLQRPVRWLQAISRVRASISGGPNFAYELCIDKITPEERATLDLSCWQLAFSGAEPIRSETLDRFAETFAPCGFRREAFYPCYGLAEGTLIVSGGAKAALPVVRKFSAGALEQRQIVETASTDPAGRTMVSCGRSLSDQQIVIVDPEQLTECPPDRIGEIWVSGDSVAQGYWNQPAATAQTFQARLAGTGRGPFLRTGDLGFLQQGELFVTGRLKDLIIIRGRNHYPQDIELTVEQSHPVLRAGGGAAFSIDLAGEERLVVAQEVERHYRNADLTEVIQTIRQAVAAEHDLQVYAVVLLKTGSIPKTSSGKIQRHACRAGFLDKSLESIASSLLDIQPEATPSVQPETSFILKALRAVQDRTVRYSLLTLYLQEQVARVLHLASAQVNIQQPINGLGFDSLTVIELKHEIETSLGIAVSMSDLLQGPSVAQLADEILVQFANGVAAPTGLPAPQAPSSTEAPLSYGQQSLWFLYQLAPESAAYNVPCAVRVRSPLNVAALQRSLQKILERHPALRTTFAMLPEGPIQRIHPEMELAFQIVEAATWSAATLEAKLAEEAYRPFDLEQGPLLRVYLFRQSASESVLLLVMHHIITDFWSLAVLVEELSTLYPAECAGRTVTLPPLRRQYADYARWQQNLLAGSRGEQLRTFWSQYLAGELPVLNLPTDRLRPPLQTYRGQVYTWRLNAALTEQLKALSRTYGTTLNTTLLAAFQALLCRYTGQEDLCVGSLTAGRNQADFAGTIGYFVNPIVLRTQLQPKQTFLDLLEHTRQSLLGAFENQDYPFNLLVDQLQQARDLSRAPLFQVMFVFQRAYKLNEQGLTAFGLDLNGAQTELAGLQLESLALEHRFAQFDLTLTLGEVDQELAASFEYNADLFAAESIERMAGHFRVLLESITANPTRRLSSLLLVSEEEWLQLLAHWQSLEVDHADDMQIQSLFETQAVQVPDAIAVVCGDQQLTYGELNQRADQLAAALWAQGIGPEVFVGLCLERSLEMLIGVFGILKAGGAYAPFDPAYPQERLALLLADTRASIVLTHPAVYDRLQPIHSHVIDLEREWATIAAPPPIAGRRPQRLATNRDAACIVYTSGSTGRPKGVILEHQGIVNLIHSFIASYQPVPGDKMLPLTSVSSASFVGEILPLLCVGGTLVLPQEDEILDFEKLFELISRQAVSMVSTVPAMVATLNALQDKLPQVRLILSGGEALGASDVDHLLGAVTIVNGYGLTETTVCSTFYDLQPEDFQANAWVPIGKPIINTEVYVLDRDLNCLPIGCRGELYVAGAGLARGYWGNPELTAERFIPNPYQIGERMYRTGDMARWLPHGVLEYLHRTDHQVKIRGYRIELGEVQSAIKRHPKVREAFVMVREDTVGDKRLVAYVVPAEPALNLSDLRDWLTEQLPLSMIPSAFARLDALPLTSNGKVDVKALPVTGEARPELATAYTAPHSEIERSIAAIWQAVLKVDRVGIHDNFFELGGNSLLIAQAHHRLREELKRELSLVDMFKYPTVNALAQHLSRNGQAAAPLYQDLQVQAQKRKDALRQREQRARQRLHG